MPLTLFLTSFFVSAENTPLSHERAPKKRRSGFDSELRDTGKRAKNEGLRTTPKSLLKKTSAKKVRRRRGTRGFGSPQRRTR